MSMFTLTVNAPYVERVFGSGWGSGDSADSAFDLVMLDFHNLADEAPERGQTILYFVSNGLEYAEAMANIDPKVVRYPRDWEAPEDKIFWMDYDEFQESIEGLFGPEG